MLNIFVLALLYEDKIKKKYSMHVGSLVVKNKNLDSA